MSTHDRADTPEVVADAVTAINLEPESLPDPEPQTVNGNSVKDEDVKDDVDVDTKLSPNTDSMTNGRRSSAVNSVHPSPKRDDDEPAMEETVGGDITVKMEPGQPPRLARSVSQKIVARPPQLFLHLPDCTAEARSTFETIEDSTYANKHMGYTEHAMECDCAEEWDPTICKNHACGEDSDCINRATRIECVGDCGCGPECQNQRFQRKEYAKVSVIQTEKKGFGLRAETDLEPHQFIFEYIGEIINEVQFRRRMLLYDQEGIKHFYFMSLSKGEFVDATKKGNLGRFCNHSCNPNCYVDKWVVGEKLRMGIFAERSIKTGEELVFNYNVDRYGADPQPCYCGEPNCTGFIGGRTQTERATKLSNAIIEALGLDDAEGWDTAVSKRPRKKKIGEEDEEFVDSVQPKSLDESGVTKVMAVLMQCKEKWIAVKLLGRIQLCEDEKVRSRVVKMHGYQILNSQLSLWKEDYNVVLQILDILDKFPRLTRNKIIDSKIEDTIKPLTSCGDDRVEGRAAALLDAWANLEVGYRIPRMKRDPTAAITTPATNQFERREPGRGERKPSRSRSRSRSPLDAPKGPASRGGKYRRRQLPAGWFAAESNGRVYYYSSRGDTTWTRPIAPAPQPSPPPKPESRDKALQDIIDGIMNAKESIPKEKTTTPSTPQASERNEIWRTYTEEKQKKLYENTLFPHIKYVVDRFKHKLPKEDLKRHAKDVAKKLVNSDFKNNRVEDPTTVSEKQQKKVKQFCKEYFEKAVARHREREKNSAGREKGPTTKMEEASNGRADGSDDEGIDVKMSDDEADKPDTKIAPPDVEDRSRSLKRKREEDHSNEGNNSAGENSPIKQQRPSTPPPPPPPPMNPGDEQGEVDWAFNQDQDMQVDDRRVNAKTPGDEQEVDTAVNQDLIPAPNEAGSDMQADDSSMNAKPLNTPPPPPPLLLLPPAEIAKNDKDQTADGELVVMNQTQISIKGQV